MGWNDYAPAEVHHSVVFGVKLVFDRPIYVCGWQDEMGERLATVTHEELASVKQGPAQNQVSRAGRSLHEVVLKQRLSL